MTIQTDAQDLLRSCYVQHDCRVPGFMLADTMYLDKLAACTAIVRASKTRERWAVKACNGIVRYQGNGISCGTWTDADEAAKDRSDEKTEASIRAALAQLYWADWQDHIVLELQGDPRGAMVQLHSRAEHPHGMARIYA